MKSYSQFVTESNEVVTTLVEEVYQDLLESGYTEEQISASYYFYEHLVEEGLITENPIAQLKAAGGAIAKSPVGRMTGRLMPGLGTALYGMDAVDRFKKGDWGGGLIQGTGAALSAIPGVGGLAATAPAFINFATDQMGLTGDKSKGQPGYKPPTPAATSTGTSTGTGTRSTPAATKPRNSTVLALKGGVQGRLDKATGKFTAGNFSDAEKARYTAAGGKIPSAKPATTAGSSAAATAGNVGSTRAAGNISNLKTGVAMSGNAGKIPGASGTMKGVNTSMSLKPQTSGSLSNLKQGVKATGSSRLDSALASVKPMNSGNKVNTSMSVKPAVKPQMTAAGNKTSDLAALRAKAKNDTLARARM